MNRAGQITLWISLLSPTLWKSTFPLPAGLCPTGTRGSGLTGCRAITACNVNNGGCDRKQTCTDTPTGAVCGKCPNGYDTTAAGCVLIEGCKVVRTASASASTWDSETRDPPPPSAAPILPPSPTNPFVPAAPAPAVQLVAVLPRRHVHEPRSR